MTILELKSKSFHNIFEIDSWRSTGSKSDLTTNLNKAILSHVQLLLKTTQGPMNPNNFWNRCRIFWNMQSILATPNRKKSTMILSIEIELWSLLSEKELMKHLTKTWLNNGLVKYVEMLFQLLSITIWIMTWPLSRLRFFVVKKFSRISVNSETSMNLVLISWKQLIKSWRKRWCHI